MAVLYAILSLVALAVVFVWLYLAVSGLEKVTVHTGAAWELESKDEEKIVLKKKLVFAQEKTGGEQSLLNGSTYHL